MPWGVIIPILTAVSAAAGLATTGYELANQPSGSSASSKAEATALQQQQQQQQANQQKVQFLAAQPNVQAATGGNLMPTAFNTQTATQAGVPSDLNSIARYLGLGTGGGGSPGSAPVTGGVTAPYSATAPGQQQYDLQTLSDLLKTA